MGDLPRLVMIAPGDYEVWHDGRQIGEVRRQGPEWGQWGWGDAEHVTGDNFIYTTRRDAVVDLLRAHGLA